jgi:hypothetical protein
MHIIDPIIPPPGLAETTAMIVNADVAILAKITMFGFFFE